MFKVKNLLLILCFFLSLILLSGCNSASKRKLPECEPNVLTASENGIYLDKAGTVWTWGLNESGAMGVGEETQRSEKAMQVMTGAVRIAAGNFHNLVLDNQGNVWQWGNNESGAFGEMTESAYFKPVLMFENAVDIYAYGNCSFAIKSDGSLWAWGRGAYGTTKKLSDSGSASFAPYKIMNNVVKLQSDVRHLNYGVLKEDGSVWFWGNYDYGQLGNGKAGDGFFEGVDPDTQAVPVKASIRDVADFAMGEGFVLTLKEDGTVWAWGNNEVGQIGNGKNGDGVISTIDAIEITPVQVMENVKSIAIDYFNCYAIDRDNNLYFWGDNTYGNSGDNRIGDITTRVKTCIHNKPYQMDSGVKSIFPSQVSFVLREDDTLWGCGDNVCSMLGAGIWTYFPESSDINKITVPNLTYVLDDVYLVTYSGFTVSCIKNNGSVWLWGDDPLYEASGVRITQTGSSGESGASHDRRKNAIKDKPTELIFNQ